MLQNTSNLCGWSSWGLLHRFGSWFLPSWKRMSCVFSMSCEWFSAKRIINNHYMGIITWESVMKEGINNKGRPKKLWAMPTFHCQTETESAEFQIPSAYGTWKKPLGKGKTSTVQTTSSSSSSSNYHFLGSMLVFRGAFPNSKETANHDCHFHDPVAFQWLINGVSSSIHLSLYPFYRLYHPLSRCSVVPLSL